MLVLGEFEVLFQKHNLMHSDWGLDANGVDELVFDCNWQGWYLREAAALHFDAMCITQDNWADGRCCIHRDGVNATHTA